MSEDRTPLNGDAAPVSLPADLAAVERRLARDGVAWQKELSASPRLIAYINSRVPRSVDARPAIRHKGQDIMDFPTDTAQQENQPSRYRRTFPIAAVILLLLLVGGYFGLQSFHRQPNAGANPKPTTATPTPVSTRATATPASGGTPPCIVATATPSPKSQFSIMSTGPCPTQPATPTPVTGGTPPCLTATPTPSPKSQFSIASAGPPPLCPTQTATPHH